MLLHLQNIILLRTPPQSPFKMISLGRSPFPKLSFTLLISNFPFFHTDFLQTHSTLYLHVMIVRCNETWTLLYTLTWLILSVSAKCYFFGPGTTIHGADYRREFGTTRKTCAESCKNDICCMGFEFLGGRCTLKSRSLNGTIAPLADAYFGLCLDFGEWWLYLMALLFFDDFTKSKH